MNFDPIYSWPKPVQTPYPPLYFGGGPAGFKRIARLNAGWLSMTPSAEVLAPQLEQLRGVAGQDVPVISFHGGAPTAKELEGYLRSRGGARAGGTAHRASRPDLRRLDELQAEFAKLA